MAPASIPLLANLHNGFSYLAQTPVIPSLPWTIFGIIHATRVTIAYRGAAIAGGYEKRLSIFQAAIAPCILILSGGTITGALLGITPGWLISPVPFLTYGVIPVIVGKSPLARAILKLPPLPRDLFFSVVDGFARTVGITTFGVDTVLSHPNSAVRNSPWAMVVVATLAGGGGGLVVPSIKAFHADWGFATPPWLKDGPSVDIWGATVVGYVYATLMDAHPVFRQPIAHVASAIPGLDKFIHLPKSYLSLSGSHPLLPQHEAKIFCSLLLAALLCFRVVMPYVKSAFGSPKKAQRPAGKTGVVATSTSGPASSPTSKTKLTQKKTQ